MICKTFHKGKYYITFKRGFEDFKKDISISIEKLFENDSLRICMSDENDPKFLCVLNVTRCDYGDLKKQQGLLIDFDDFPSQLVRLLQQCASNNMFLVLNQVNAVQLSLEFIEHNEFKRLVHLSLRTGPATDADIIQHMADTIATLKASLTSAKSSASNNEASWSEKLTNMERKIHELNAVKNKMEEDKLRRETEYQEMLKQEKDRLLQEALQWQKNTEMNVKAQLAMSQEKIDRKDKQIDELNHRCMQLQDNKSHLEHQLSEKTQRLNVLESEVQKSHIEVATLNAKNAALERELAEKDKINKQLNSKCAFLEKSVKDNEDVIKDLKNTVQILNKEKASLEERLTLSESLANKNNEAARSTSEQLLKANQIISRQNGDLIEMKDKLLCRTAIALEQEKVIDSNTKEIEELKSQVNITKKTVEKLEKELDNLKVKYESNEEALKDRDETIKNNNMVIQWLHKKVEDTAQPNQLPSVSKDIMQATTSSTPYFNPKNQTTSSQGLSDESIDFYATSKLSNVENSPLQEYPNSGNKTGLHSRYLKPSTADDQLKNTKHSSDRKSVDCEKHGGKENKNFNLPRVDYREKKSSKSSTYRATPISAYFPR